VVWFTCTCAIERKGDDLGASHQIQSRNFDYGKLNEEETMHQLEHVLAIEKLALEIGNATLEEVMIKHAFC
jgi:hypothetical protein